MKLACTLILAVVATSPAWADQAGVPHPINFEPRVVSVMQDQKGRMDAAAKWLKDNPELKIHLVGHTDNAECLPESARTLPNPGGPICSDTGKSRAIYVASGLRAEGITSKQLLINESKGETDPIASNDTEEGRAENRRVEFVVYVP